VLAEVAELPVAVDQGLRSCAERCDERSGVTCKLAEHRSGPWRGAIQSPPTFRDGSWDGIDAAPVSFEIRHRRRQKRVVVSDGNEPDVVAAAPERGMQLCHVVDEATVSLEVDARRASRHQRGGDVAQEQRGTAVAAARDVRSHRDGRVVDAVGDPVDQHGAEESKHSAVEIARAAHDPVVVKADVLQDHRLPVVPHALEPAP
jgi:hypothetical protein